MQIQIKKSPPLELRWIVDSLWQPVADCLVEWGCHSSDLLGFFGVLMGEEKKIRGWHPERLVGVERLLMAWSAWREEDKELFLRVLRERWEAIWTVFSLLEPGCALARFDGLPGRWLGRDSSG